MFGSAKPKFVTFRGRASQIARPLILPGSYLRHAGVAETVIMKITGHRTRSVFERYNITDRSDTQEAGRLAGKFLAREYENLAQNTSQNTGRPS